LAFILGGKTNPGKCDGGRLSRIIQMYLREMEDNISLCVSARDHIKPQLPHEEHKVGYVDRPTCRTHTGTHTKRFSQVNTKNHHKSKGTPI